MDFVGNGKRKTKNAKKGKKEKVWISWGKKGNIMSIMQRRKKPRKHTRWNEKKKRRIVVKKGKHEYFVGNRETWYKRKKVLVLVLVRLLAMKETGLKHITNKEKPNLYQNNSHPMIFQVLTKMRLPSTEYINRWHVTNT